MATLAAPLFLVAALAAAAAVVALHFLRQTSRRPAPLPTARFIPAGASHPRVRPSRLNDLPLLLLRIGALLLAGLALAGLRVTPPPRDTLRVVLADVSRASASAAEVRDSVGTLTSATARAVVPEVRLFLFDSTARAATDADLRRALGDSATRPRGSLSAALISVARAIAADADRYDSLELHVVSPLVGEEVDAATSSIARTWRGRIAVHRVRAAATSGSGVRIETALPVADPLGAAIALARANGGESAGPDATSGSSSAATIVRHVRGDATDTDREWARGAGHVLVVWPAVARDADSLDAVVSDAGSAIGRFVIHATPSDSTGRVIAWWSDGQPAAREVSERAGCTRTVAFAPSTAGDFALSLPMVRQVQRMSEPCGVRSDLRAAPDSIIAREPLPSGVASASAVDAAGSPLAAWLLAAAIALLLAELPLRRRRALRRAST